jgi:hypothetical protein
MVETTPIFSKKYTAEYNTSADSLAQLATYEWLLDLGWMEVNNEIRNGKKTASIHNLLDLTLIYSDRLNAIAWKDKQDEINKWENEVLTEYNAWVTNKDREQLIPVKLMNLLRSYKKWLYIIKQQNIRLGIPMREQRSASDSAKKAIT